MHSRQSRIAANAAPQQNEHTSPEAKKHAREILEAHGYTVERAEGVSEDDHQTRVLAGYKAALNSESYHTLFLYRHVAHICLIDPRVSDEAKAHAREFLKEHNAP